MPGKVVSAALVALRLRGRATACCNVPQDSAGESVRLTPAATRNPVERR